MARKIATNTDVGRDDLVAFARPRHRAVLMTTRPDGSVQASPVIAGIDPEGRVVVSTYPQRAKSSTPAATPPARCCSSPTTGTARGCR